MFSLSQARTVWRNACCSEVSEKSISPPEVGRCEAAERWFILGTLLGRSQGDILHLRGRDLARASGADAPAVLTGSHIDTVPEGGILDGALGVLAGLEALQTIREAQAPHRRPLAVAAWSDEEGRYGSLFGSRAFCGRLDLTRVEAMTAVDGERLIDAMARAGFDPRRVGEATAPVGAVAAYVELHIEQGPRLEDTGIPTCVVDAIIGDRRNRLTIV